MPARSATTRDSPTVEFSGAAQRDETATWLGAPVERPPVLSALGVPDPDRYVIQDWLGRGGFGEVYQVFDRERGESVAMKVLRRSAPRDLERFKREFRAITDLVHPNLVSLHELGVREGVWFFTMELVEGVDLRTWVRGARHRASDSVDSSRDEIAAQAPFDRARFLSGAWQLVRAVAALHEAGRLHRDLKPSNVLVTEDERLVVLDFGLVKRLDGDNTSTRRVMGTAAYMAPELVNEQGASEASDWYAVGIVLYELLAGRAPFRGEFMTVLQRKTTRDAPSLARYVPDEEPHIVDMVQRLLSRDPAERPGRAELLAWAETLGPTNGVVPSPRVGVRLPEVALVGRDAELDALREAWSRAAAGDALMVCPHGAPGAGKSSLVRRYLAEVRAGGSALVLSSRCFERESVPYKAFDGLVQELVRGLRRDTRSAPEVAAAGAVLGDIFPALGHLAESRDVFESMPPDPHERVERARSAMQQLLTLVAAGRPLVLSIDDLQWGDVESAELLRGLLAVSWPDGLLVIGCYRTEERARSACLSALAASGAVDRNILVGPLSEDAAIELACQLVDDPDAAAAAARESQGDPLMLRELVRFRVEHGESAAPHTLDELFVSRLMSLPPIERAVFEAICVAAQPTAEAVARRVVGDDAGGALAVRRLLGERWLRRAGGGVDRVLAYHDRVRTAVVASLEPERLRAIHLSLAEALQHDGGAEPQTLVSHYIAGGEPALGAAWALTAASRADRALAFERAAELYAAALANGEHEAVERREIRAARAEALANAGRPAEAADAFLAVAEDAGPDEALEAKRRAAEQLIRGGHVDRGLELARDVLDAVGVPMARGARSALARMVVRRAWLRVRGLSHMAATESSIPLEDRLRIDMGFAIGTGLALTDTIGGLDVHTRTLLHCLRVGEPFRLSRALALEAGYHAAFHGAAGAAHSARLVDMARALASPLDRPQATAMVDILEASVAWCEGRFVDCLTLAERGTATLRDRCTGVDWELSFATTHVFDSMAWVGDWHQVAAALPDAIERARDRGDLYSEMMFTLRLKPLLAHAANDPDAGSAALRELRRWSTRVFDLEHLVAMYQAIENGICRNDAGALKQILDERWPALQRSNLLRMEKFFVDMHHSRGRARLAQAAQTSGRPRAKLLDGAIADARMIERRGLAWTDALCASLRAGEAACRGDQSAAIAFLQAAEAGAVLHDLHMYARAARWQRGALVGGDEGAALQSSAASEMLAHGVSSPPTVAHMLIPGVSPR